MSLAGLSLATPGVPGAFGYGGGWALGSGYAPLSALSGVGAWLGHAVGPIVSAGGSALYAAGTALAYGTVTVGGAILIVLLTPSVTGDLTISSPIATSSPYVGPPLPTTITETITRTLTRTTYFSSATLVYHNWNGLIGTAQGMYLAAVPDGDRIIWPYLSTGWVSQRGLIGGGTPFDMGGFMQKGGEVWLGAGLNTRDSFLLWFEKSFPASWTDLGLVWTPDMMSANDPRQEHRWKWDGYGWLHQPNLARYDPDGVEWFDGGIHPDFLDYLYVLGNFAHSLAQRGAFFNASGELRKTFTNLYGGLTLVIKSERGFDVWNSKQLSDYAWKWSNGATADPRDAVPILEGHRPLAEEFVLWESPPHTEKEKVSTITLTKTKTKMKCCPLVLKKLKKIKKILATYVVHDVKGYFPPICLERGTKNRFTGEPIVDWNNRHAVNSLVNRISSGTVPITVGPGGVKEIYAGKGLAGIAKMIKAQNFQQSQTALATDRAKALWCEVAEPELETRLLASGIEEDQLVSLTPTTIYVILNVEYDPTQIRNFWPSMTSALPDKLWAGHVLFKDSDGNYSPEYPVISKNTRLFLPFPSSGILIRPAQGVRYRVSVRQVVPT